MPASTPIYGIPYPCLNETIDPDIFCDFADAVNAAMLSVQTLSAASLARPSARVSRTSSVGLPVGVDFTIPFSVEDWDSDNMVDLAIDPSRITVQTRGTYLATCNGTITPSGAGNLASGAVAILRNGVVATRNRDVEADLTELCVSALLDMEVGDYFQMAATYTGTIAGFATNLSMAARMTNRL